MALKLNTHIKELPAPKQRRLYTEPITELITDKKIKLQTEKKKHVYGLFN